MDTRYFDLNNMEDVYPKLVQTYLESVMTASSDLHVPRSDTTGRDLLDFYDSCFHWLQAPDYRVETLKYLDDEARRLQSVIDREYFEYHMQRLFNGGGPTPTEH